MRRITALLLSVWMLAALAACGKSDSAAKEPYSPPTTPTQENAEEKAAIAAEKLAITKQAGAYIEDILGAAELEHYRRSSDELVPEVYYLWDTEKSPRPDRQIMLDLTIDGTPVKYGDDVSALLNAGYQLDGEDNEVPAGFERSLFPCENEAAGKNLKLALANFTDADRPAKECSITGMMFSSGLDGVDFRGLTQGSTVEDAIRILGIPSYSIQVGFRDVYTGMTPQITLGYGYGSPSLSMKFNYNPERNTTELYYLYFS